MRREPLYKIERKTIVKPNIERAREYFSKYHALRKPAAELFAVMKKRGVPTYGIKDQTSNMKYEYNKRMDYATETRIIRVLYGKKFIATASQNNGFMGAIQDIRADIRAFRGRLKNPYYNSALHENISKRSIGHFLKVYRNRILKTSKTPRTKDVFVGIEVECVLPSNADTTRLLPFGKWVNVGSDGSIRCDDENNETGTEIRICVERENIRQVLPPIMAELIAMGAYVNKSCGLHVHLDQRNNPTPEKSYSNLVRSLGLLYTVVPASRRNNTFCKRNRSADFTSGRHSERYKAINATAYDRYKTIEVRLFGGTLEANKILNWIETLFAIATGETVLRCPKSFDTARKYWNLSDENLAWLKARQERFSKLNALAPQSEAETDVEPEVSSDPECDVCGDPHYTDEHDVALEEAI